MKMLRPIVVVATTLFLLVAGGIAAAQPYPDKPIRLIIAFPPGGTSDFVGRVVAAKLSEYLGQPIVVDNRAGASGLIGTKAVQQAAPDGTRISSLTKLA